MKVTTIQDLFKLNDIDIAEVNNLMTEVIGLQKP